MSPKQTTNAIEVVAALIRRGDDFLICQRPAHKARGLLWEFAGGKVEAGENSTQALTLFQAVIAQGDPQQLEHADLRWVRAEELPNYAFCPADAAIIRAIVARFSQS